MNVLVAGGSGFIGIPLCRELADRGHDVTAMSRSPDADELPDGVEPYAGDVTDYDSIEGTFEGQDAVVNLVALSPLFVPGGGESQHLRVHLGGTENIVEAAETHGVDRLVQQSGLGAEPDAKSHYLQAKGHAEEVVRESELDWVITRPSIVFGDGDELVPFTKLVTTPYVTGLPGGGKLLRLQLIWVEDFTPLLADCVEGEEHGGQTYEFGGPKVYTLADVTRLIYKAEGKSITILPVPMPMAKLGLTAADYVSPIPLGSDQYHGLNFDNTVAENAVETFGVDLDEMRTFEEYLGIESEG